MPIYHSLNNVAPESLYCRRESPSERLEGTATQIMKSDTFSTALPVELRVEVFFHFCGMYCPIGSATEGPILLLAVCKAWRDLALQTPSLWKSFTVDFRPLPGPRKRDFLITSMRQWIQRSRNLPLYFRLHSEYPVFDAASVNVIESLLPSSPRWCGVALHTPGASLLPLWEARSNSFPLLRSLTVETVGHSSVVFADLGLNWSQLTELDLFLITIPTLDECFRILKQGVNLRRCTMNAICRFTWDGLDQLIELPRLQYLCLTAYGGQVEGTRQETSFMAFLSAMSLPSLQFLRISWNVAVPRTNQPYYWSDGCVKLVRFLKEVQRQLQTLHLAYLPLSTRQLVQCLEVLPSLRRLAITISRADMEHCSINDELLGALTAQSGSSGLVGLVPYLQQIRLEGPDESFSNPALLRFVTSRWKYQESNPGELDCIELVSPKRGAHYRPGQFRDLKEGRIDVAARLKSKFSMVKVISTFLNRDTYGDVICFMNGDFTTESRLLLALDQFLDIDDCVAY